MIREHLNLNFDFFSRIYFMDCDDYFLSERWRSDLQKQSQRRKKAECEYMIPPFWAAIQHMATRQTLRLLMEYPGSKCWGFCSPAAVLTRPLSSSGLQRFQRRHGNAWSFRGQRCNRVTWSTCKNPEIFDYVRRSFGPIKAACASWRCSLVGHQWAEGGQGRFRSTRSSGSFSKQRQRCF